MQPTRQSRRANGDHPREARDLAALQADLEGLRQRLLDCEAQLAKELPPASDELAASARNLLHYVALRSRDLRAIQERLARLGLSSLGRSEPHVLATLDAVLGAIHRMRGVTGAAPSPPPPVDFDAGRDRLDRHTEALLGAPQARRVTRIMVTLPASAATDRTLVRELLGAGMNCARINCAHDDASVWSRQVENVRRASQELNRPCGVLMDLPGPKLRTGALEPAPGVIHIGPERDDYGRILRPAALWLIPEGVAPPADLHEPYVHVNGDFVDALAPRNEIRVRDLRDKSRIVIVRTRRDRMVRCEIAGSLWLAEGVALRRTRKSRSMPFWEARVLPLPPREEAIVLKPGDELIITREQTPGHGARRDDAGTVRSPARIPCTLPEIFTQVRANDPIAFDDGRIRGVVRGVTPDELRVQITLANAAGSRLGADKGINLPESPLSLPALTPKDIEDLDFVVQHADLVALSFVHDADDVRELYAQLDRRAGNRVGVVLKVETRRCFDRLPRILLAAMRKRPVGVMIARGDLAVECGYERLAEVQEEILWLSEAAHIPVIWATQVLETLAKKGLPTRAEITDAAMSERAECVMLNKGPHIVEAVRMLDEILTRMQDHQDKKRSMMRRLSIADSLIAPEPA